MELTFALDAKTRKSNAVVYKPTAGQRGSLRISKTLLSTIPDSVSIDGPFAEAKKPRATMTPEERKAARLARPKLTVAQKLAKAEARLAKLRAEAAAATPAM